MKFFTLALGRYVATFLSLVLAAFVLTSCGHSSKPEAVVEDFYKAVGAKRVDDAIDCVSLENVKESDLLAVRGKIQMIVGQMYAGMEKEGGLDSVKASVADTREDQILVKAVLKFKNGTQKTEDVKLVKTSGKWKIHLGGHW